MPVKLSSISKEILQSQPTRLKMLYEFIQQHSEKLKFGLKIIITILLCLAVFSEFSLIFSIITSLLLVSSIEDFITRSATTLKVSRSFLSLIVTLLITALAVTLTCLAIVIVFNQLTTLFNFITTEDFLNDKIVMLNKAIESTKDSISIAQEKVGMKKSKVDVDSMVKTALEHLSKQLVDSLQPIITKSYLPGLKILHFFYTILINSIFLYYFLSQWDYIRNVSWNLLGVYAQKLENFLDLIKNVLVKTFLGQLKVTLTLIVFYGLAFFSARFDYYLIFGLSLALLKIIPVFGGVFAIILMSISCYILDFSLNYSILLIGIVGCGMLLESLILTPKLVGKSINAHPLVVIAGVVVIPKFLGFSWLLLGMPMIAVINQLVIIVLFNKPLKPQDQDQDAIV